MTGLPPRADWKLSVAATGTPVLRFRAFLSAFHAEKVGLIVNVTAPGAATALLPFANTTLAGRHLPASRTKPGLHFATFAANTPNLPF